MRIIRRLILFFYVLIVLAVTLISAGVCLRLIPELVWQSYLEYAVAQPETLVALALVLVVLASLIIMSGIFSRDIKKIPMASTDLHLDIGKPSEVKVALSAIITVIEYSALTVAGVREVKAVIFNQDGELPLSVKLTITLAQGFSAPKISAATTSAVDTALQTALELSNVPVEVRVVEIVHASTERTRRVV